MINPSALYISTVNEFADHYVKSELEWKGAQEASTRIIKLGEKEGLPDTQQADIIKKALQRRQLSDRQIRRALPARFKRQYTKTPSPKKEPLVGQWQVECLVSEMKTRFDRLYKDGKIKAMVTHDNRKVVNVE